MRQFSLFALYTVNILTLTACTINYNMSMAHTQGTATDTIDDTDTTTPTVTPTVTIPIIPGVPA